MHKVNHRSQKVQSPAVQAEALRNTFRANTTQLRQTVRDFFTSRRNWDNPDMFLSHHMNTFEQDLVKFRRYNLGTWKKYSSRKQIQLFTSANAIAKALKEWCGVSRFVIAQTVITKLLRLQARKGRKEIGGYCKYRIIKRNGKKIVLLLPHHVPKLKTSFDKDGTPHIAVHALQTLKYGVVFHVHPQNPNPRPSGGDIFFSEYWKPNLVLNHYSVRGVADLVIPHLLHPAPEWVYGEYVHVDILSPKKLRALLKTEEVRL